SADVPSVPNWALNSATAPATMTIRPAAGPLMVSCELLTNVPTRPPMTAVQMPAMAGKPLARAMARHSGMAIRKTRKPESKSASREFGAEAEGWVWFVAMRPSGLHGSGHDEAERTAPALR